MANTLNVHLVYEYDKELIDTLRDQLDPGIVVTVGEEIDQPASHEVLICGRPDREQITAGPDLHTLIVPWVGIPPQTRELLREFPDIAVHNIHFNEAPTAETAVALLLAAAKFIIPYDQELRHNNWTRRYKRPGPSLLLNGKTALILGYGAIGKRVAKVCAALEMTVLATKRHIDQTSDQFTSEIHPPEKLEMLLPRADCLIICLPLTSQTEDLIGPMELELLPEKAILVNIGRGTIVNEAALYTALKNNQLASAAIDVWYNYPNEKKDRKDTPVGSYPFHELENIVMSPHRASDSDKSEQLRMSHLAQLINSINKGEDVPNKVDLSSGY